MKPFINSRLLIGISVWMALTIYGAFQPNLFLAGIYTMVGIWALWGIGWNLVYAYTAEISLGQSAFVAVGTYATVIAFQRYHVFPLVGWLLGGGVAICMALVIGGLTFRLAGTYFTLASLAFAAVLLSLILHFSNFTGGPNGLQITFSTTHILKLEFISPGTYFAIAWLLVGLLLLIQYFLPRTRLGYLLQAINTNPIAAEAAGANVFGLRLLVLSMSALVCAIGGVLYAFSLGYTDASYLSSLTLSIDIAVVAVIGGTRFLLGPVVGAIIIEGLTVATTATTGSIGGLNVLVTGSVLIMIMLLEPLGALRLLQRLMNKMTRLFLSK